VIRAAAALFFLAAALAAAPAGAEETAGPAADRAGVAFYDYEIVNVFPHDPAAFTQGLFVRDGRFIESTGQYGESSLREVEIETGEVRRLQKLPARYFGEGIVEWEGDIVALTWRSGVGFVFDGDSLRKERQFDYDGEGWGLTRDEKRLIMSDGTPSLRFLDPETLEETGRLVVTFRGRPLARLNELEWVKGEIFANVWGEDAIVRIDPDSGVVTGVVDLGGLLSDADRASGRTDVLNGIAYDPVADRLFVTGKYWPSVFEIDLKERSR